ncbi:MAG: SIMPL domain-containing protein [Solirubrobacteraceae bacterium]
MAAVGAVFVGLLAVGVLGVASAETTPAGSTGGSAQARIVSVEGVAKSSIEPTASEAAAKGAYREAMASAIADGKEKAQFLAEKAGSSLGAVQSIAEGSGYISCPEEEQYEGAEPDFGSGASVYSVRPQVAARPLSGRASTPAATGHKKVKKRRRRTGKAKAAAVQACTLSTQVALSYELG